MTEVAYAKSFLAALDARPVRIPTDHVEDPKKYPTKSPFILPRMPNPMKRPDPDSSSTTTTTDPATSSFTTAATDAAATDPLSSSSSPSPSFPGGAVQVVLRALTRAHFPGAFPDDLRLPPLAAATTAVLDVRRAVADRTGIPLDKLRLLHRRKPVADSKTLRDLLDGKGRESTAHNSSNNSKVAAAVEVEFSVMVMGGAATAAAAAAAAAVAAEKERARQEAEAGAGMGGLKATTVTTGGGGGEGMEIDEEEEPRREKQESEQETTTTEGAKETVGVAQGLSGAGVLETAAFWTDLRGFLQQRIRDEDKAAEAWGVFREAWEGRK